MAVANGRIATKNLVALPAAFSNKREIEHLTTAAYASLVRMMLRATAETSSYFSVWDAYRSLDEQIAMLKLNYRRVSRGRSKSSDRTWDGSTWAKKAGRPNTASPGYSNHGNGVAVDIHPGPIQAWLKSNASRFGWVNDVPSEPWHWSYLKPGSDQYRSEGTPDVAGMQKALGIEADGKPGPGTADTIRAYQKANKLTVDGKAGPDTMKAILGKGDTGQAVHVPDPVITPDEAALTLPELRTVEQPAQSPNCHENRIDPRNGIQYGVKHITVHWWGEPSGQSFDGIVNHLRNRAAEVSAHYVISATRVAQVVDEKHSSWANGNRVANFESITIECDPNDVLGTLPILAALIKDIRSRHGDLPVYPHSHWTSTLCCGDYEPHLAAVDQLARTGKTIVSRPSEPSIPAPAPAPVRKVTLMDLVKAPDFPLLRTTDHKCFYGDQEKLESVSGKLPNSLAPGDITGTGSSSGSRGLKVWQKEAGLEADGRFGAKTKAKAKAVQKANGLTVDEAIGPDTWYAIFVGK